MQRGRYIKIGTYLVLSLFLVTSCGIADLRTDLIKNASPEEIVELGNKGRALLKASYEKQGLDVFGSHQNYTFTAHEKWNGFLGKLANPWGVNDEQMRFSYRVNSFDGRVEILSGKKEGTYFGLQSWKYYEGKGSDQPNFNININIKKNDKIVFSIPAYHYFVELLVRLQTVPITEYAGNTQIGGVVYDMVLATWGENSEPTKEYDQYLVFINQKTGLLEYCTYSAHENKMPGNNSATATIHFDDYREMDGIWIPMLHKVILSKPKKEARPIHQMKITSFQFDVVADSILFPNTALPKMGDKKPSDL